MEEKIVTVLNEMSEYLSIAQMKKLQEVILKAFAENEADKVNISNDEFLEMFLAAKRIEGCSDRTIQYYKVTVEHMLFQLRTSVRKITTEEIRVYLSNYQKRNNCSNVTIDNIRRNISSFFSWLEEEDYILKSPMKRIHKIKTKKVVKNTISDEAIEKIKTFPALFLPEANDYYAKASDEQQVIFGFLDSVRVQDNGIKIRYQPLWPIPMQQISNIGFDLGMKDMTRAITEMNHTHWAIKRIDLIEELKDAGISLFGF